jgi:uncharacterized protein (TIGR02145 family)
MCIEIQKNTFTDPRDGRVYRTVKIGSQVWMTENLNYDAPGSVCHDNDPANGEIYGRFYDWETAKKACPSGWHLPSKDEWEILSNFVGGRTVEGKHLRTTSGWNECEGENGNGTDDFGFSAMPGGLHSYKSHFECIGEFGCWWSSSSYDNGINAYSRFMFHGGNGAAWLSSEKNYLHSVRCLQD